MAATCRVFGHPPIARLPPVLPGSRHRHDTSPAHILAEVGYVMGGVILWFQKARENRGCPEPINCSFAKQK